MCLIFYGACDVGADNIEAEELPGLCGLQPALPIHPGEDELRHTSRESPPR
jgi:hypothetical protein